ncbi:MAG: RNase adapter RapZ [Sphingomonadales bacterium]
MKPPPLQNTKLLLVTGMSGAGKSTALNVLEDLGYEAIDNLPLELINRLLRTPDANPEHAEGRPLAIGVDSRTRSFLERQAQADIERLRSMPHVDLQLLYFDCSDNELAKRFSQTRRRHPLALDRPVTDGIIRERSRMAPLRELSDVYFDTTSLTIHDLKRRLVDLFAPERSETLTLTVMSFGFSRGVPRDADLMFDMRFLRNPHYVPDLRPMTGLDEPVAAYVAADKDFTRVFDQMVDLIKMLLPRYKEEGKAYLTIAIGCTGGRHRSVFTTELLAKTLEKASYKVHISLRDVALSQVQQS